VSERRGGRFSRRAVVATLLAAAALAALGSVGPVRRLEERISTRTLPAELAGGNRLRAVLRRGRSLDLLPPEPLLERRPLGDDGRCPDLEIGPGPIPIEAMPSTRMAPPDAVATRSPVLSLYVDWCRLYWLHGHRKEHGREWEEPGWVTLFVDGEPRFASAVGVRMHGGTSRKRYPYSYRLYFRPLYGERAFPGGLLDPELRTDPRVLVVKRDVGVDVDRTRWPLAESVAFEIGRRLGAVAPAALPIGLSINGLEPTRFTLEERIDLDFLRRRFGHRDLDRVRGKVERGDPEIELWRELRAWVDAAPAPLTREDAAGRFDLDAIDRSVLTALVAATGDAFQDTLVRDRTGATAGGLWTTVLWDLDWSFHDYPGLRRFSRDGDLLPFLLESGRRPVGPLQALVVRLLAEDPDYRAELRRKLVAALNHRLDASARAEIVTRHRRIAERLGIEDLEFLDRLELFLERRPGELLAQAEAHLDAGPPERVRVVAPPGAVAIDGFLAGGAYEGLYPRGERLSVRVEPAWRERVVGWRVDGADVEAAGPTLELAVDRPLRVEVRFE